LRGEQTDFKFLPHPARKKLEQIHDFKQSAPDHQTPEGNPEFGPKSCGYPVDTSGLWKFRNRSRKSAIPVFDLDAVGGRNAIGACSFLPSPHTNDIPVVPRQILNENLAHHPIFCIGLFAGTQRSFGFISS
jgi:hypothetical protein